MTKDSTRRGTDATKRTTSKGKAVKGLESRGKAIPSSSAGAAKAQIPTSPEVTIGLDLGDRESHYCVLDSEGHAQEQGRLTTTPASLRRRFGGMSRARIAMEVGTHSPWTSRLLTELGHEVLVANARKLRMIYDNRRKQDRVDAETLARVARMTPSCWRASSTDMSTWRKTWLCCGLETYWCAAARS